MIRFATLSAIALCATALQAQPSALLDEAIPVGLPEDLARSRPIVEGLTLHHTYSHVEPWNATWVRVEMGDDFTLRAVKGAERVEGRSPISAMAPAAAMDGMDAVAAINGDFWAAGSRPVGLCVVDGKLLTLGNGRPAVIQTTEGERHMGRFHFTIELEAGAIDMEIDDVNIPANRFGDRDDPNELARTVIYTDESMTPDFPAWPPARLAMESDWAAVAFQDSDGDTLNINAELKGTLTAISPETFDASLWSDDMLIIVGYGADAEQIRALPLDTEVEIEVECAEFDEPTDWALGGGPILVRDGEVVITAEGAPGFGAGFTTTYHPRSLIGWNDDEMILMVIDGRQPNLSRGMSLMECGEWMVAQGMTDAMNFDGGGSSSLWAGGDIVSRPSDAGGERWVTDGLVVLSALPQRSGMLMPNPFRTPGANSTWKMFPEDAEVIVNESLAVHPRAYDADGNRAYIPRESSARVTVDPPDLATVERTDEGGLKVIGNRLGTGEVRLVRWNSNEVLASSPLLVGRPESHMADSLEEGDLPPLSITNCEPDGTTLSWVDDPVHEGERALAFDYAMIHGGGTSAANVDLNVELPETARRATLWVYGDEGEAWLRGIISDADGEKFIVDFTNGTEGVNWEGWHMVSTDLMNLRAHWDNPEARADAPFTLATIYLAQTRESHKTSGRVVIDEIGADVFVTE